jgi:HK97 gp10 family phage protein
MGVITITGSAADIIADLGAFADRATEAARPAAQAMAQVIYDAIRSNIPIRTGNLRRSIYQVYSYDNSVPGGLQIYHISWNHRRARYAHLVEWGHYQRHLITVDDRGRWITHKDKPLAHPVWVPAKPFMRPAADQFNAAYEAGRKEFIRRVEGRMK